MRCLVTGGAGFIGSHLSKMLLENGYKVVVLDDLSTGSKENVPSEAKFLLDYSGNVWNRNFKFDGVFHLGIPSSPYLYRENPGGYSIRALQDFLSLLEFVKEENIKLVFASTSSVYNGNLMPYQEDMDILIKDYYTEIRYYMERLAKLHFAFNGTKIVALRLFAVFGENEESKKGFANVVTQMMWAKKKNEEFEIWGDGTQGRDFIYVKDVCRAFIMAMDSNIYNEVFNIGSRREYSLNELNSIIGVQVRYIDNPMQNYVEHTLGDTTKVEKVLGFKPIYNVEKEIKRLLSG